MTALRPTSSYSRAFFETFAAAIPAEHTALEAEATARLAPPGTHPRLLEIGCGTGRVLSRLAAAGFHVTGIDASVSALRTARAETPSGRFVALDFRHVGRMRWRFDVIVSYWNSLGFGDRADDARLLDQAHARIEPGGRLILDLYHPAWLAAHQLDGVVDPRGARVYRWLEDGRSCHRFEYATGGCDDIRFQVYHPDDMQAILRGAGFVVDERLVWWNTEHLPSAAFARYQLVCRRP